jgi:hypothetical protein
MKIKVIVGLDIDADAWMDEYGIERSEVRSDVIEHVGQSIRAHLSSLGLLTEKESDESAA